MARARVELRGSLTHQGGGRLFKKGSPQILTNPAEILYYQSQAGFAVTMLADPAASKKKAAAKPAPAAPPPDEDEDEGEEEGYSQSELNAMTKAQLIELAAEYELDLDDSVKKADMVEAILEAQG